MTLTHRKVNIMKLFLAPIQGVTFANYRNYYAEIFGGIDEYYAPFIATTKMRKSIEPLFRDVRPEVNDQALKLVPQLIGNNSSDFKHYAAKLVSLGYKEINWNLGCPFPTVTKKIKGSGLLPHPEMIRAFLDEVCKDNTYDFTVKMRLGMNHVDEGSKVMEILNDYPLQGVTIHGRTGVQKYTGHVDLDAFETLYRACKHEVIYNGDIYTTEDFTRISGRFPGIEKFMLGRGAMRDPFLPSAIKGVTLSATEKLTKLRTFHDGIYDYYENILSGDTHLCDKMKEFWFYTSVHIDPTGKHYKKIKKCGTAATYLKLVDEMFQSCAQGNFNGL